MFNVILKICHSKDFFRDSDQTVKQQQKGRTQRIKKKFGAFVNQTYSTSQQNVDEHFSLKQFKNEMNWFYSKMFELNGFYFRFTQTSNPKDCESFSFVCCQLLDRI